MKRPDKWSEKAKRIIGTGSMVAVMNPLYRELTIKRLAAALRRTDSAAEKRGIAIGFKRSCVAHTGGKFNDR